MPSRKPLTTTLRGPAATPGRARRPKQVDDATLAEIMRRFEAANPTPEGELEHIDPYTLLVAVVLSAQATDKGVNIATRKLFAEAPDAAAMVALGEERVSAHIRTIGLFRTKAKNVVALSRILAEQHGGIVPPARAVLETLPGVGKKTASVVMNIAFGEPTIAVDTHVFRVSNRIPLFLGKTPDEIQLGLERRVPPAYLLHAHHWLILHGRYVCKARLPDCPRCSIADLCRYPEKTAIEPSPALTPMSLAMDESLLDADEPSAVSVTNTGSPSPLVLVSDHGERRVPRRLGDLGLKPQEFDRHIAWDIGIAPVSRRIAAALGATLVEQGYSRLVIDCNRPPAAADSSPETSESTPIPGNHGLSPAARAARRREIFDPYHAAITAELDARADRPTVLVAMHSFTPVYHGEVRPWHIGMMHGRDGRVAKVLGRLLEAEGRYLVGDNKPYDVTDDTDHTIPVHGEQRGLPHVGIEIRQDLIADERGQAEWAEVLGRLLPQAAAAVLQSRPPL